VLTFQVSLLHSFITSETTHLFFITQVLACGQVFKHDVLPPSKSTSSSKKDNQTGSKQRRILVLTDMPRLLFLDPVGNIVRGNLELTSALAKVEVKTVRIVGCCCSTELILFCCFLPHLCHH